jgi:uroporphyrinogen III methyltransferase/synthase
VERTWGAVVSGGGDARAFGGSRIAAIGPATARALEGHGLRADVVAKEFRGEGLAEALLAAAPAGTSTRPRALLARAAKARDVLPDTLRAAGWDVDVVAAYETRAPSPAAADDLVRDLERGRIDAVVLTSSSTVDHLCDLLGPAAPSLLARVCVASIGPVTTATAIGRGVRVDVTAAAYTVPGLVHALEESWA